MGHAATFSEALQDHLSGSLDRRRQEDLDLLAEGALSWGDFFCKYPQGMRQATRLETSKEAQSLMHLAVLSNQIDLVQKIIAQDPHLKMRKNAYGLTPMDLAQLLEKEEVISMFGSTKKSLFSDQPNVMFEGEGPFETISSLGYASHPLFPTSQMLKAVLHQTQKTKEEDLIPTEKIWMGVYFDHELLVGIHPKVSVRWIDASLGFGVFAKENIAACTFIGEYTGELRKASSKELHDKFYCVRYPSWGTGKQRLVLDAEKKGNFTRLLNHSFKPNLGLQSVYWRGIPRMIFIALQDIEEGAQLTFDYGPIFWKEHKEKPKVL